MPAPTRSSTTRTALLTAAESLLLTDGYEQVSARAICAAAGANPAAVHYHFGSKDALVVALLEDRMEPRWADLLNRFDPASAQVVDLVDLILEPFATIGSEPVGQLHLRLLARFVAAHPDAEWTRPWFRLDQWSQVLAQIVEGLDVDDARRRWGLAFGLILDQCAGDSPPSPTATAALRDFVVAGLSTPARSAPAPEKS
ncbi:TetR family transcriptional regulator [Gordonia sp. HNM0687]|uniref:TetR family transcriptional regulator n=1 Tax=Gordonia mangrovi TaxID=2665643 RepID=A0A6L7GVB5_9ACTN|nr:TetR/AcrR family transcriptional regulator [Gordonia mangrovi]MXP23916.1 TetR family transcriptional regulator [Gordonia mangrovi]UVF76467.1 TetR/AcrR family transcriptional regulator [Gordonia mangrovi]